MLCCLGISAYGVDNNSNETTRGLFVSSESMLFKTSVPIRVIIKADSLGVKSFKMEYSLSNLCKIGPLKVVDLDVELNPYFEYSESERDFLNVLKRPNYNEAYLLLNDNVIHNKNKNQLSLVDDGYLIIKTMTSQPINIKVVVPKQDEKIRYTIACLIFTVDLDKVSE